MAMPKYVDLLSNILGVALISKTTHENIGFEKLQQIINLVPWECFFFSGFLNIVWEYLEIDIR